MGIYFATASRDRTARLWSTDRATSLRIYAGHLSDVDVRPSDYFRGFVLKPMTMLEVSELPSELTVFGDRVE